jgi:hypothetical protein
VELYDLAHDAGETRDLAATTPSKAMELQGRLREWLKQMKAHMPLLDGRPAK